MDELREQHLAAGPLNNRMPIQDGTHADYLDESSYDSSPTPDAGELDRLRSENTGLATEVERLRTTLAVTEAALAETADEARAVRRLGRETADALLRRVERLRRAVARERRERAELAKHLEADHAALDDAGMRLNQHACAIRVLSRQRDDLLTATRDSVEALAVVTAERNEARRAVARVAGQLAGQDAS